MRPPGSASTAEVAEVEAQKPEAFTSLWLYDTLGLFNGYRVRRGCLLRFSHQQRMALEPDVDAVDLRRQSPPGAWAHLDEATRCRRSEARVRLFGAHPVGTLGQGDDPTGRGQHRQIAVPPRRPRCEDALERVSRLRDVARARETKLFKDVQKIGAAVAAPN